MTSTEQQLAANDAISASPRSEPTSFEIIDAPAVDVAEPVTSQSIPDADTEALLEGPHTSNDEKILLPDTRDTSAEPTTAIHALLLQPLIIHVLASKARKYLVKDFAFLKRALDPRSEPPQTDIKLSALNLRAAARILLSTLPDDADFCSRLARHPVLAALGTHPASDPGSLAFTYILINSVEGEELARRVADIHAARVRDWLLLRAAQARPVYESLTDAARAVWEQSTVWAPSIALSGSAIALFVALDS